MPKYKLMIARFPYLGNEATECVDWLMDLMPRVVGDARFDVTTWKEADTPITMTRNDCLEVAKRNKVDLVLMVDSDMAPDVLLGHEPAAKPFFQTSVEFMLNHAGPCAVGAPYCGPPPHENVYVFEWQNFESGQPNRDLKLGQYTREDAFRQTGIKEVAALPTGLFLLDVRALKNIDYPYFQYEYEGDGDECPHCGVRKPGPQNKKASTEDVVHTRDLSLNGVKQYCNWDAWAGHVKRKVVGKPLPLGVDILSKKLRDAMAAGQDNRERLVDWKAREATHARSWDGFVPAEEVGGRTLWQGTVEAGEHKVVPVDLRLDAVNPFGWQPGLTRVGQDLPPIPEVAPVGLNGQE